MSETNKDIAVTFYKAVIDGRIEDAFRLYAGTPYLQHNPLIEDGMEGFLSSVLVGPWQRWPGFTLQPHG
jgi:predicted SnoaL-like aldol condensation-catalyzing enzyme